MVNSLISRVKSLLESFQGVDVSLQKFLYFEGFQKRCSVFPGPFPGVANMSPRSPLSSVRLSEGGSRYIAVTLNNCPFRFSPGLIRTPFRTRLGISEETEQAIQDALVPVIPSRRAGEPSDVTSVILFLASEQASYVTGAMWTVDGGITTAPVSGTQSREQMSK